MMSLLRNICAQFEKKPNNYSKANAKTRLCGREVGYVLPLWQNV